MRGQDNVTVIYTPWSNLKKDGSMAVGQVGFTNQKLVRRRLPPCARVLCQTPGHARSSVPKARADA